MTLSSSGFVIEVLAMAFDLGDLYHKSPIKRWLILFINSYIGMETLRENKQFLGLGQKNNSKAYA